ncbi:MAG: hypothetical protein NUV49_02580, partial [Patescibacteria group bacterium]|nr:hypothetical protein [Patescibacteria group bacterium]
GSVSYPLTFVNSQRQWDFLNAIQIQTSATPEFIFPRNTDFGIFPIPQGVYTITFNYHFRERDLLIDDYTTGSIAITNGTTTITGTGTTFAAYMAGMYLEVTDTTVAGWGYPYKIASFSSTTSLTLEQNWQDTTITGAAYKIFQSPEIPEEGHIILLDGVTADYYASNRDDITEATWWNNKFFTGDGQNSSRREGDQSLKGGLIGLMNFYADRNKEVLINRRPRQVNGGSKIWATTLS